MADPWRDLPPMRFTRRDGAHLYFVSAAGDRARAIVSVLEDDVVRVRIEPFGTTRTPRTWAVVGRSGDVPREGRPRDDVSAFTCPLFEVAIADDVVTVVTPRLRLAIHAAPLRLTLMTPDGVVLMEDHPELAYQVARAVALGEAGARGIRHTLRRDRSEVILGLGEASGPLDRHHRRFRLRPGDALGYDAERADPLYKHLPILFTLPTHGAASGVLYDTGAEVIADLGSEIDHYLGPYRSVTVAASELDHYLMVGPELAHLTRRVQDLTGFAPLPPRWSLGYLGSTMRYTDAENPTAELAGFVTELQRQRIGCSGFHLSSGYSLGDDGCRYVFEWNRRRVPDPAAMVAPLANAGIRTLANVKPALLESHPDHAPLAAAGAFVRAAADDPHPLAHGAYRARFWGGSAGYLDFTSPRGYDFWSQRVRERILGVGIDATWNDNNEFRIQDDEALCHAGAAGDLRPTLTLLMNHASREAQRAVHPERRDYQVTRSGGLGMQRYAQTWSGDNQTDWRTLAFNLPMGLSLSLCGWANHGHDVGGFAGPAPDPELFVRWIEAGISQPRFSIHSWNDDGTATEPWSHPTALPNVRRLMALRTALVPYLATLAWDAVHDGTPLTRPLAYAFQGWQRGWRESFVHMLGDALLIAPVLEPGAKSRRALLPPGRWLELGNGRVHPGDAWAELDAPLGRPVWLLREGYALPLADVPVEATTLAPAWLLGGADVAPPLIRWLVFPDAAGCAVGSLVWEDGVSRAFERGAFDRYAFRHTPEGSSIEALHAGTGLPAPAFDVWRPAGTRRLPWFESGWQH
jgi:alpha-glucosidase